MEEERAGFHFQPIRSIMIDLLVPCALPFFFTSFFLGGGNVCMFVMEIFDGACETLHMIM